MTVFIGSAMVGRVGLAVGFCCGRNALLVQNREKSRESVPYITAWHTKAGFKGPLVDSCLGPSMGVSSKIGGPNAYTPHGRAVGLL